MVVERYLPAAMWGVLNDSIISAILIWIVNYRVR